MDWLVRDILCWLLGAGTVLSVNCALTFALFFDGYARSRRFAAMTAIIALTEIAVVWLACRRVTDGCCSPILALGVIWPGMLVLRSLWRLWYRPRVLYEPPPDPPPLGGPYRS